jgi:preprotein translocase subunit Sss1
MELNSMKLLLRGFIVFIIVFGIVGFIIAIAYFVIMGIGDNLFTDWMTIKELLYKSLEAGIGVGLVGGIGSAIVDAIAEN